MLMTSCLQTIFVVPSRVMHVHEIFPKKRRTSLDEVFIVLACHQFQYSLTIGSIHAGNGQLFPCWLAEAVLGVSAPRIA
jgi:hypothetical protein